MGWNPFKAAKKVVNKVASPFRKVSKKLVPRELRWMAPYLSAAAPFMLPGGFAMGNLGAGMSRGIMSALANVGGQAIADPEGEDINLLSTLLAGGAGYGTATGAADNIRGLQFGSETTKEGILNQLQNAPLGAENIADASNLGILKRGANIGLEGLAQGAEFLGGAKEAMGGFGDNPASLFTKAGATEALKAGSPIFTQGTGDVAKASADKYTRDWEATDAAEQAEIEETSTANDAEAARLTMKFNREAGNSEEVIQETLELNGLSEYYEPPVTAAQGGIIGLKNGGMLNLGGNEMDYRGGGFVPIGKRERADDVPARLSKNEFVMTADAVKAAGGGSVNKGAQRMYNVMNNLEARA